MTPRMYSLQLTLAAAVAATALGSQGAPVAALGQPAAAPAADQRQRPDDGSRRGGRGADLRAEQVDRTTRVLALGPAGSLELKTLSGDVTVTAGPGRDVHLEIVRRSRGRSDEDARQGLTDVQAVVDHQGERAAVTTRFTGTRRPAYRVDVSYIVTAPAGTRVSASSVSGDVSVREIQGDLSASSTSGDVTVSGAGQLSAARSVSGNISVTRISSTGGMTVNSVSGRIELEQVRARRVEIDSTSGDVIARGITSDRANLRSLSGSIDFEGAILKGGRYEFQSHSGNVRLVAAGPAGFQLQAGSFSGNIQPDGSVGLRDVSDSRRSLRGTSGDGSAVVVVNTFSGNISIARR